jgi:biopolymer transport protein ExbD
MRRFSDRNTLVTLSDINVTPLLDLAFVLLIIFMITTPLLDQGMNLELPTGGAPDVEIDPELIRVVEVDSEGGYFLDKEELEFAGLSSAIGEAFQADPNINVYLRADKKATFEMVARVLELLTTLGVPNVSVRTEFSD